MSTYDDANKKAVEVALQLIFIGKMRTQRYGEVDMTMSADEKIKWIWSAFETAGYMTGDQWYKRFSHLLNEYDQELDGLSPKQMIAILDCAKRATTATESWTKSVKKMKRQLKQIDKDSPYKHFSVGMPPISNEDKSRKESV